MPHAKIATHQATFTLVQLHKELGGKILDNKTEVERLRQAMVHVEAVLKLIDPSFKLNTIAIRRRKPNGLFKRGTVFRAALAVLRNAEKPLTTAEIIQRMVATKGIKEPEPEQMKMLFGAVGSSLRNNLGTTIERAGEGYPARWRVKG